MLIKFYQKYIKQIIAITIVDTNSRMKQQSPTTPKQQSTKQTFVIRKIPETLIQSYDLVSLKEQRKKRYQPEKIEEEDNSKKLEIVTDTIHPIHGSCLCWYQGDTELTETIYQLSATSLVLSKFDILSLKNITKVKLKLADSQLSLINQNNAISGEHQLLKNKIIKISWAEQHSNDLNIYIYATKPEQAYYLYAAIVTRKMLISGFVMNGMSTFYRGTFEGGITSVEGDIPKMSAYLKNWQRRRIIISEENKPDIKDKQRSYELKSFKQGKFTFSIKSIRQLWTRFSMHNGYLIIKMHHGIEKTEVGIPLVDYTNICSQKNWMFMIAKLLK